MSVKETKFQNMYMWLATGALLVVAALLLRSQGRIWICSCGYVLLWAGDIWSADNSQHIFDPYSFTHILHGFGFFWLLYLIVPRLSLGWRLWIALLIESAWEVAENSSAIIDRYREATLALGYNGDTILNSMSDILLCGFGFWLARRMGWKLTLVLFIATEVILAFWIRDGLLLNMLMLIHPIESIKAWQMGK